MADAISPILAQHRLGLEPARQILFWALERARQDGGAPVCLSLCDGQGELLHFLRMDLAPARCIAIAQAKAYTAARFGVPTRSLAERLEREALFLPDFQDSGLCSLPGGAPLLWQGHCIAALGVSGRSLDADEALCREAIRHAQTLLA
ncbi:MAG TPA: heme-binding protein [Alcaligenes sp.]|nr:heme-binding protein [Alcaligenes sp.]HRL27804.1 heme-binding protein [Alcaligenes sp.]